MTKTELVNLLSKLINDHSEGTGTSIVKDTITDSSLKNYLDDTFNGFWLVIEDEVGRIRDFDGEGGALHLYTPLASLYTAKPYQLHKFSPSKKTSLIDMALTSLFPWLRRERAFYFLGEDNREEYAMPIGIVGSPSRIQWGMWVIPDEQLIEYPGDATWTADGLTATELEGLCGGVATYLIGTGTLSRQAETAWEGYKGLIGEVSAWVHTGVANKVRLYITVGATTVYSSYHTGSGWEKLSAKTALLSQPTVGINVAASTAILGRPTLTPYENAETELYSPLLGWSYRANSVFTNVAEDTPIQMLALAPLVATTEDIPLTATEARLICAYAAKELFASEVHTMFGQSVDRFLQLTNYWAGEVERLKRGVGVLPSRRRIEDYE